MPYFSMNPFNSSAYFLYSGDDEATFSLAKGLKLGIEEAGGGVGAV